MPDLFSTLSLGARALQAHRTAAATASHNLENASTAGYARQRTQLTTNEAESVSPIGFVGTGVRVAGISQARDRFVEARLPQLFAQSSASQQRAQSLSSVSVFDPDGGVDLAGGVSAFFSSMRELSTRPGDASTRRAAVSSANIFAQTLNRAAEDVEKARGAIDDDLRDRVPQAQRALDAVARLNKEIKIAAASGGGPPNDLLDERQRALDAVVQATGAVVIPGKDGDVGLALKGGQNLVSGDRAVALSTGLDGNGRAVIRINGNDVDSDAWSGAFGGALAARDQDLGSTAAALDAAANTFRTAINAAHAAGFARDGSTGRDLFTGTSARDLAVNAAVKADPDLLALSGDPARPGDTQALVGILGVEQSTNPAAALSNVIATFGAAANAAIGNADADDALLAHGLSLREATSGVSVDEELIELQRSERAFQAASKVISTADSMLETLLNLKN